MENPPFGRFTVNRNAPAKRAPRGRNRPEDRRKTLARTDSEVQPCNLALYRILPAPVNLFLRLDREKYRFFRIPSKYAALWAKSASLFPRFSRFLTQNARKLSRFLSAKHLSKRAECAIISYIMPISAQESVKGSTGLCGKYNWKGS